MVRICQENIKICYRYNYKYNSILIKFSAYKHGGHAHDPADSVNHQDGAALTVS